MFSITKHQENEIKKKTHAMLYHHTLEDRKLTHITDRNEDLYSHYGNQYRSLSKT